MRRLLNQAANAAVKANGRIFELVYRLVVRLGPPSDRRDRAPALPPCLEDLA
jgi:hypothetical protein